MHVLALSDPVKLFPKYYTGHGAWITAYHIYGATWNKWNKDTNKWLFPPPIPMDLTLQETSSPLKCKSLATTQILTPKSVVIDQANTTRTTYKTTKKPSPKRAMCYSKKAQRLLMAQTRTEITTP
jgi:hypothetical protein